MPREHDCEVVMGIEADPSDAQKGLQELESSAEDAAQKAAKAAAEAASITTTQTEKASEKIRKKSKETSDQIGDDVDAAGKKTRETTEQTKDRVVAAFQAGQIAIGNIISSCVQKLTSALTDAGKTLLSTGVEYNAQIEKYRTGLTNMLGDAEKADQALATIQSDAARTPYDTAALVQANQYLISAGENAAYSRKTILALGDAVSATGGTSVELERMAQNLQQVANAGKASSVDVKQFAMAGINIYQVLADYTGKSVQDVQDMTITYDVLTQALQAAAEEGGRYYNSMSTQSETLTGRLSTLKDNATQLAGALTEELSAGLGSAVEKANELAIAMKDGWNTGGLDGLLQSVRDTAPELSGLANIIQFCSGHSQTLITLLGMAAGAMLTYGTAATTAKIAQTALNVVMAANPIGIVITLLGALAGAFGTVYASSETFRTTVNNAFQSVASTAQSAISTAISWLDQLSYKLNRALGKNGYTDYNSYADWKASQPQNTGAGNGKNTVTDADRQRRKAKHDQRVQQAQAEKTQDDILSSIAPASNTPKNTKSTKANPTVTERTDWSQQDAATSYSNNDYGTITTDTTELTEHILKSDGSEYTKLTKTVTESGKEMVNGVIKDYKTVTTYVDKFDKDGKKIGDTVAQTQKVYENAANTISSTSKKTSTTVENGITKTTETTKKKMADGKEHTVEVVTETGERIVEGVAETYTKATTYVDGFEQDVQESAVVIEQTVKATQKRIESNLSEIKTQLSKGVFGIAQNIISGLKNQDWGEVGLQLVNLIWGEVSQTQREAVVNWANDALTAINEAYDGGGLNAAVDAIKALFADGFKNGDGKQIDSIAKVIENLTASGGMGEKLGKLATQVGQTGSQIIGMLGTVGTFIGTFASNAGAGIASLAANFGSLGGAVSAVGSAITSLGGLILANPEIAAVLAAVAIVAGVVGLGAWLWKKYGPGSTTGNADSIDTTPPELAPAGNYTQSDTITAAELTRRTQAASVANQSRISSTQNGTGTVAAQQLNATLHGSLTATFNVDGRELAQTTVPYMDEELGFRQ